MTKTIEVEIEGLSPYLMNSPQSMVDGADGSKKIKKTTKNYEPKKEAERVAYKTKKGYLYIPASHIRGAMLGAAKFQKIGKASARTVLAGCTMVSPEEISLGMKKYDIDARTVVVQRSRVVRWRPSIPKWKAKFEVAFDDEMGISAENHIIPLLEQAGKRIGIGDFRPEKLGWFGRFKVNSWKVKKDGAT